MITPIPVGRGGGCSRSAIDPAQNNNLADEHPAVLQEMIADYQKYHRGGWRYNSHRRKGSNTIFVFVLPLNQTQTIELDEIIPPFKRPNASAVINALGSVLGRTNFIFVFSVLLDFSWCDPPCAT